MTNIEAIYISNELYNKIINENDDGVICDISKIKNEYSELYNYITNMIDEDMLIGIEIKDGKLYMIYQ